VTDTFIRSVDFQMRDDGRTLEGRIVPYGEIANVIDPDPETKGVIRYREQFLPHSLAAMVQGFRARRGDVSKRSNVFVPLLIDHNDNFDSMIGQAVDLDDRDDGAYGTFRLYDDDRITKIRSVLTESHTGLSVMFRDTRNPKVIDGVVSRVQVVINHVAATPVPAYSGAAITSMRETGETVTETPLLNGVREWLQEQRELMGATNE
jgi:HK97 family phage prohead protease